MIWGILLVNNRKRVIYEYFFLLSAKNIEKVLYRTGMHLLGRIKEKGEEKIWISQKAD
jgi:hypothetical protein